VLLTHGSKQVKPALSVSTFLGAAVGQMRLVAGPATDSAAPAAIAAQVPVAGLLAPPGTPIVAICCASLPATALARAMQ
jgi:hypothetical protein